MTRKLCRVCSQPLTKSRAIAAAQAGEVPLCAVAYCKEKPPGSDSAKLEAIMTLLVKMHERLGKVEYWLEKADREGR